VAPGIGDTHPLLKKLQVPYAARNDECVAQAKRERVLGGSTRGGPPPVPPCPCPCPCRCPTSSSSSAAPAQAQPPPSSARPRRSLHSSTSMVVCWGPSHKTPPAQGGIHLQIDRSRYARNR
jgi:hypothetical protein